MQRYCWVKSGPCRVVEQDEARLKVLLPGRLKAIWVSKTQVEKSPASVRLAKIGKDKDGNKVETTFDQDCGCTPVVDMGVKWMESYNIYGSVRKYLKSDTKKGSDQSPHHRRKALAEQGYTRARGKRIKIKNSAKRAYGLLRKGYKIVEWAESKAPVSAKPKVETPKPAPTPAPQKKVVVGSLSDVIAAKKEEEKVEKVVVIDPQMAPQPDPVVVEKKPEPVMELD